MANKKVTLIRICKTDQGWKRYPAAIGANGKIRPGYAVVDGKQIHFPEGHYALRTYEGSRMVYQNVGDKATDGVTTVFGAAQGAAVLQGTKPGDTTPHLIWERNFPDVVNNALRTNMIKTLYPGWEQKAFQANTNPEKK